ncbi:PKD1 [Branchiostoma lanceolatum]|uniref:PKD1 protein n=1 Tax=Branchiostoma lanceolatum TaxID=7740 RepID=A0A8J9Z606_BRALA|nr:PKD1 [Branchiostoma lanceolatum]
MKWYVGFLYDGVGYVNQTSWGNGDSLKDVVSSWLQDGLKVAVVWIVLTRTDCAVQGVLWCLPAGYDAGCSSPSLVIVGAAPQFQCTDMYRRDRLHLSSRLTLNCSQNVQVRYAWVLEYLVLADDSMYVATLPSDVPLDLYDLVVPATVLDYGILGIQLNASICGDSADQCNNIIGSIDALGCFMVVPSALVAQLAGGSSRSVPSGSDVVLDASQSHDPDANVTGQELTYDWGCDLAQTGSDCSLPAGTLDLQTSVLEVSGADLQQGQVYRFSVLVSYPGRTSSERVNQTLAILQPDVPTVQIRYLFTLSVNSHGEEAHDT